jgi:hypothetical protein
MKKSILIIAAALCAAFAHGAAVAIRLNPGLSAPDIADGARLEAAVLASTNAAASCMVKSVYELPVYDTVRTVSVVTNDYYTPGTNYVVGTNATLEVTDLFTVVSNPTQRVTNIYTVDDAGATNYYFAATNYFRVWTNAQPVMVNTPFVTTVTNDLLQITGTVAYTNDLFSLSGGYAETNNVNRWLVSPARFLVTGEPVTIILTR